MTQHNKNSDPLDLLGGALNSFLGSALGENATGKTVNPVVDGLFTKAEGLVRTVSAAANAAGAAAAASHGPHTSTFPKPTPKPASAASASAAPSAPKADAPKDEAPKHAADEAPFGGVDLPSVIEEVVAFGQGTLHGLGNMLGFGDEKGEPLFTAPDFTHVFKANAAPPLDIVSTENSIEYRFAVAGVKPENVAVELDGELLTVTINTPKNGAVKEGETVSERYVVQEIWSGNWSSEFAVPAVNKAGQKLEIDEEAVKATVKDGLVSVLVPFKERIKTKIAVS